MIMKWLLETTLTKEECVSIIKFENKQRRNEAHMLYLGLTDPAKLPLSKRIAAKTLIKMLDGLTKIGTFDKKMIESSLKSISESDCFKMESWMNGKFIFIMDDLYYNYMQNYSMVNPAFNIKNDIKKTLNAKIIEEFK